MRLAVLKNPTLLLMLVSGLSAAGQEDPGVGVGFRSVVSPDTCTVGDPVQLSIYITLGEGLTAETIQNPFAGLTQMELTDVADSSLRSGSATIRKFVFTAVPFDTGVFVTDSVYVRFRTDKDTTERQVAFAGDTLVVRSVLDEGATEIMPEKPPFPFEFSSWLILLTVLILLALIGIIVFTVLWLKKRRLTQPVPLDDDVAPGRPPAETALEALIALGKTSLLADERFKEFHIKASEIVRIYIEEQFGVEALEMTTPQLLSNLRSAGLADKPVSVAKRFLEECDLVKFAKHVPTAAQSGETLNLGKGFVRETADPVPADRSDKNSMTP